MRRKRALPSLGIGIGIAAAAALAGAGSATDPLGQQETISDEGGRPSRPRPAPRTGRA